MMNVQYLHRRESSFGAESGVVWNHIYWYADRLQSVKAIRVRLTGLLHEIDG